MNVELERRMSLLSVMTQRHADVVEERNMLNARVNEVNDECAMRFICDSRNICQIVFAINVFRNFAC